MTSRSHAASFSGAEFPKPFLISGPSRSVGPGTVRVAGQAQWPGHAVEERPGSWPWPWPGLDSYSWTIAGEAVVFLAILTVVARVSYDTRQSAWLLTSLSVALVFLSWFRRKLLSAQVDNHVRRLS